MSLYVLLVLSCLPSMLSQTMAVDVQTPNPPTPPPTCVDCNRPVHCPPGVAWWAIPSERCGYTMYPVGGDCPIRCVGDPPRPDEGTWGWDFVGRWLPRNVILGWWHDRRPSLGESTYKTDGPNLNSCQGVLLPPIN